MFDQDDRDAEAVADARDDGGGAAAFVGGHAGDGFVEEKDPGLHAQGSGEFGELLRAVRQRAGGCGELIGDPDELGDLRDPFAVDALLADRRRQPQAGRDEARAGQPVPAEHQAVGDGGVRRQGEVLEGAGDAEFGDAVRVQPGEFALAEVDGA